MWSVEKEKEIIPKVLQLSFSSISCVFRYTNTVYSLTTLKPSIALIPFQNNVENGQRMGKEVHKQNFGQTHQKCGANLCCHGAAVIPPPVLLWATDWATRARAGLSVLPLAVCPKPLGLQLAGSWNALQPGPQQGVVCLLGLLQDNQWDAIK